MRRQTSATVENNPLAIAWGQALRTLRGSEQSSKIATILGVSISFMRLLEIAATKMSSSKILKLIAAFPQLEFQPLSKFLTVLNILSLSTDDYTQYELAIKKIREASSDDDYSLDILLGKLQIIIGREKTLERSILEPILLQENFKDDIIKYVSTRTFRSSELNNNAIEHIGINDEKDQGVYDAYDKALYTSLDETPSIYVDSTFQNMENLKSIDPNLVVNNVDKLENQNGDTFVSVVGVFRNFAWMPEPENTRIFPLKYLLSQQFKELRYIILDEEGTSESWEEKFKTSLLHRWGYKEKDRKKKNVDKDFISKCLNKVVIKKATIDTPLISEFLKTTEGRTNELVWAFITTNNTKIGFSILPRDQRPDIVYGEVLSYRVARQKVALFNAIWDSLK